MSLRRIVRKSTIIGGESRMACPIRPNSKAPPTTKKWSSGNRNEHTHINAKGNIGKLDSRRSLGSGPPIKWLIAD
jgi:hypothetical protein